MFAKNMFFGKMVSMMYILSFPRMRVDRSQQKWSFQCDMSLMGLGGSLNTDDAVRSCLEKNTASSPATEKITSRVNNMSCQRRMVAPKQFQMKLWNLKLQHAIPFQQEIVRALFLLCKFRSWVQNTWKCLNKSWQTWKTRASGLFTSLLALNIPSTVFKIMIHLLIYHIIYYIEHLHFSRSIYNIYIYIYKSIIHGWFESMLCASPVVKPGRP